VDNDGNALVAGSLFFDSTAGAMKVYTGSSWVAAYVSGTDYLPFSGGTMTGDVAHGDGVKATFGNSADLQIYHDSSSSFIKDAGTGNLYLQGSSNIVLESATTGDNYIVCTDGNQVDLYYNGVVKFATTSSGAKLLDGTLSIEDPTGYAQLEMGGPSGAYIDLKTPYSDDFDARMIYDGNSFYISTNADQPVLIKHNNAEKIRTTSSGINVTGTVVADGATFDGAVYVNGSGVNLDDAYSLSWGDGSAQVRGSGSSEVVELRTSSLTRLQANAGGDISFYEDTGSQAKLTWDASDEALEFGDGVKATFGASADLQIFHDGSNSWINEVGTGQLILAGEDVRITTPGAGEFMATFGVNGAATLYYDNSAKIATTSTGISVTGSVELNGWTITESGGSLYFATGGTNKMKLDASGNLDVVGSVNSNATIT